VLLAVGIFSPTGSGGQSLFPKEDPRIWIGQIKVVRSGSGHTQADNSTEQLKDTSTTDMQLEENITIRACGAFGEIFIKEMTWALTEKIDTERNCLHLRTRCDFPPEAYEHNLLYRLKHYKQEVKEPGDSSKQNKQFFKDIASGKDIPPPRKLSSVSLNSLPGQDLTLRVSWEAYTTQISDDVTRSWHACSGETSVLEFHQRTGKKIGEEATTTLNETGEGDSKHSIIEQSIPPIPYQSGFTAEVQINEDSISDSRVIGEIKPEHPGDYQEKTTASWDFTAKDPCGEVYDDLLNDLAYGEAYGDKNIQDMADSIEDFEKMVDDRSYKTRYGGPAPRGEKELSEMGLGVDPETCELKNRNEYKDTMARKCKSRIIVDATFAHEGVHESQCRKFHEAMNAGQPRIKGSMERSAYIKSAGMLLRWLEKNCPDIDLRNEKTRLEKLKSEDVKTY
jgi:hypothetical protein